jgi:hypothetical protein
MTRSAVCSVSSPPASNRLKIIVGLWALALPAGLALLALVIGMGSKLESRP